MNKCNLAEKYEFYELEDEIDKLKKENKSLINDNLELKNKLIYYESTKAHKMWQMLNKSDKKDKIKKISEIKVALISDQFTYDSYKYEFIPIVLTPNNWLKQFKQECPDIFFCESAWEGCNFKQKEAPWRGKIYENCSTDSENRGILLEILKYCEEKDIPTVFWNKEDPPHYKNQYESDNIFLNEIDERLRCIYYSCIYSENYREFELMVDNFDLNREVENLKKINKAYLKTIRKLKKQNEEFESSKMYKVWNKIAK